MNTSLLLRAIIVLIVASCLLCLASLTALLLAGCAGQVEKTETVTIIDRF